MDPLERLERTRSVDRFEELLEQLLKSNTSSGAGVAELIPRLSGDRQWITVLKCGEYGVREATPYLRALFAKTGKGLRDIREVSMFALVKLVGPEERIDLLIQALGDRDRILAEDAAIEIGLSDDPVVVPPLLDWLKGRLSRPRSNTQAHLTGEVIATCLRLGNATDESRLRSLLDGSRLTKLELLAADGNYLGQAHSPGYPEISWPV
jgi:hypothetical protein